MKIETQNLQQIKKTKRLWMAGNIEGVTAELEDKGEFRGHIHIPKEIVFQFKRGLESWTQKYYRRHEKAKKEKPNN